MIQNTCMSAVIFACFLSFAFPANLRSDGAETRVIGFLIREVPAWSKENNCFSCHNNGDAARALYAATRNGYRIPDKILADTTAWVREPGKWYENKGDPGFSDKRLADIQFAAALLAAYETGHIKDRRPLEQAALKLIADQDADGSWKVDSGNILGSPATYGTHLATYMALKTLKKAGLSNSANAVRRAERWLSQASPSNVLAASVLLLAATDGSEFDPAGVDKKSQSRHRRIPQLLVYFKEWQLDLFSRLVLQMDVLVDATATHRR